MNATPSLPAPARRIYCNRTLNLRSLRAIGFDMDYTLVHYRSEQWERQAYEHVRRRLADRGWPVQDLSFDPQFITLGLIIDLELGNIVKPNRFGYVKKACHGTRFLEFDEQKEIYARVPIDLGEPRWVFINTLFGLSEACMYAQTVDLLDAGKIHEVVGYGGLYGIVRSSIDETHVEGKLKEEIAHDPDRFVELDEELALTLLDLKYAGKKLLLITNSEWPYTRQMMHYALDGFLPRGTSWRDLFDLIVVSAGKPNFFTQRSPVFEVVEESGLLRPFFGPLKEGHVYFGGHAGLIEEHFGLAGEEILYVGDHIFSDVRMSKNLLRWRTALVLRELEAELESVEQFKPQQAQLTTLMESKELLEHQYSLARLALQRLDAGYGQDPRASEAQLRRRMQKLREGLLEVDREIAPLAQSAASLVNPLWGPLMRTGNDKSHLARQIERYADVYMSRVSNLLHHTPFVYLRSPRGSLPHDSGPSGGV